MGSARGGATAPSRSPAADLGDVLDGAESSSHQEREILQEALRDLKKKDPRVKISAIRALGRLKHRAVVPSLVEAFDDRHDYVRSECLTSLAEIGERKAAALFKRALFHDESSSVRLAAVRAFHRLDCPESVPAIVRGLQDEHPRVRRRAALCLGWLGAASDAPCLLPLFRDEDRGVRAAAVESVGALRFRSAIPALIKALGDPDGKVRERANHSLERITGKSFGTAPATSDKGFKELAKKWQGWWSVS